MCTHARTDACARVLSVLTPAACWPIRQPFPTHMHVHTHARKHASTLARLHAYTHVRLRAPKPYLVTANVVMANVFMAYLVMVHVVMAYTVMANIVMAFVKDATGTQAAHLKCATHISYILVIAYWLSCAPEVRHAY